MSSKIVYGFIFVILCAIPIGYAIECYRCTDEVSCLTPAYVTCTAAYADETVNYLENFYQNVSKDTSKLFDCMRINLNISTTVNYYKGCVYSNVESCGLPMKPINTVNTKYSVSCYQCNNFSGCNPADRSYVSAAAVVLPFLFVLKYIM